ncbi:hypothetical protein MIND_00584600 [Mycena indigotica]|uniref:Uncharacterized protein n=1 Tax=Mycena indigotica TaxID=2126181 RepID=A0A8H6SPP3_9AGAR|nr:uncharacterized protein MIND_00584600 [Mycena indigotica]KAF7303553.1 hypothetical protein MIND_00584600 [Mycena indigotica]
MDDPRAAAVMLGGLEDDWQAGAWGGRDYWARAEEELALRRVNLSSAKPTGDPSFLSSSPMIDPVLPPELERVVFELAAGRDREMICTLALVARRVNAWIGPLRYQVVLINRQRGGLDALWGISERCPETRTHTRCLAVSGLELPADTLPRITAAFPHLVDLRLWSYTPATAADMKALHALPHLRRLSHNLHTLYATVDAGPVAPFSHVTHLELYKLFNEHALTLPRLRAAFPALTHVTLFDLPDARLARAALQSWPALMVLLVVRYAPRTTARAAERDHIRYDLDTKKLAGIDPRVVTCMLADFERDWEDGAWSGEDCWARAEEEVAQTRMTRA